MAEYNWISDDIFTVSAFLSPAECDDHIRHAEGHGFSAAPINTMLGQQVRSDVRNNTRVMLDDRAIANDLWARAKEYVGGSLNGWDPIGVNERMRFYRYESGQQFDWHRDGAFVRNSSERSQLTFMVYLNDDFDGGETSFEDVSVVPERGLALFFVHKLLHKGQPVTRDRKYVLRTDVMYRRAAGDPAP